MNYVVAADAEKFLSALSDASVDLFLIDPPYFGIVRDLWDNQWATSEEYASWLVGLCKLARRKVKPKGSLIMAQSTRVPRLLEDRKKSADTPEGAEGLEAGQRPERADGSPIMALEAREPGR